MSTFWVAVDKRKRESLHQHEPYYNRLHDKWCSNNTIYNSGLLNIIIPDINDYYITPVIAVALEVSGFSDGRAVVSNSIKVYA